MKRTVMAVGIGWVAALALLAGCVGEKAAKVPAADLYVAPGGNDAWSGKLPAPAAGGGDGPLATLEGARDRLREVRKAGAPQKSFTVLVRGGTYVLDRAVEFTSADSGAGEMRPVFYVAEPGAEVRLTGGREVTGWKSVVDPTVLARLPEESRGRVLCADLRAQGITNFGRLGVRGFGAGNPPAEAELVYGDAPMRLARWPDDGFAKVVSAKDPQAVETDADRVARWTGESDPWVMAYWHHDWAELYEPLAGVSPTNRALLRKPEIKPVYGITPKNARWYGFNLLAELDRPGEYYLDRANGLLYFLPPHPDGRAVLTVAESLIRADGLSNVHFRGFILENCRGTAVSIKGGEHCVVAGCTIRNTGHGGVSVSGGTFHTVYGCDVYQTGGGGIGMSGGDRKTLAPAGHVAGNNHVHHFGRRSRTYQPGIAVSGVGNHITHNLVHDGPHMALSAGGNFHVVEYNEIHNVVEESGDAGAYYVGRDWTARGNVLRYNYWHEILGATGYGGMTIYLDDQHCGHTIYGNVFEHCMQSVFIGGGDDNVVSNNVFLGCIKSAHLDNRGMGWQKAATDDPNGELRRHLAAMPYTNELWRSSFPTLAGILDDEPNIPKRNVFARNISAGGKWDDLNKSVLPWQTVTNNLVFDDDPDWARLVRDESGRPLRLEFKDPAAVSALGFAPIPVGEIGVYLEPDPVRREFLPRASWPVKHEVRPVRFPSAAQAK